MLPFQNGAMRAISSAGGGGGGGGGGTDVTPNAITWDAISGSSFAYNTPQTVSGITAPITISLSRTGLGRLWYQLNGAWNTYAAPFIVNNTDTLGIGISWTSGGAATKTGTITVTNDSDSSAVLSGAGISYTVDSGV